MSSQTHKKNEHLYVSNFKLYVISIVSDYFCQIDSRIAGWKYIWGEI